MEVSLLFVSLIAGMLTVLAPCIFPLLPILLAPSADSSVKKNRSLVIIVSLLISVTILTLLLYGVSRTVSLDVGILRLISGSILVVLGTMTLFPDIWESLSVRIGSEKGSNQILAKAMRSDKPYRDVITGMALGPVFSSCSPTYGLIIAVLLPQNFAQGSIYLLSYVLGLGIVLALVAVLGRKFTSQLQWLSDPNGVAKRVIGGLFIVIGLMVLLNLDKSFETWLLQWDFYNSLVDFELGLQ